MSTATVLTIEDIPVEFPFSPYDCQVDYMRSTMQAINTSSNAILESPTGTGKTLCLLCSTLAWQKNEAHKVLGTKASSSSSSSSSMASSTSAAFKAIAGHDSKSKGAGTIIYSSRTHSQLKQVVSELKSTGYRPNMALLGSREQLCVHDKISKLKGSALNHACNAQCAKHSCTFKKNLEGYSSDSVFNPIQDIEDLLRMGKKERICPYFYSRDNAESADLVLLPYNYLMDSSIRCTLKVNWADSIVIFDEAHNIERIASDASSFSLSSIDLGACIVELQNVLRRLQEERHDYTGQTKEEKGNVIAGMVKKPELHIVMRILTALFEIEKRIDDVPLSRQGAIKTQSCVHPGAWLVGMLDASGLHISNAPKDIDELRRCAEYILEEANSVTSVSTSMAVPDPKIMTLAKNLSCVFRGKTLQQCVAAASDYKVYIEEEDMKDMNRRSHSSSPGSSHMKPSKKRVLNYWCFSSSQAMLELKQMGVRSIIMTSGTLSPMKAFRDDLNIPISVQLENPHVISRSQIYVGALAAGPNGRQLNSSYNLRDTNDYKDELGASIHMICQTMGSSSTNSHLPTPLNLEGGILVFFPSYGHMENAVNRWKETGMYERLTKSGGGIIVEPRAGTASTRQTDNVKKSWNEKYNFQKPKTTSTGGFDISGTTDSVKNGPTDGDDAELLSGLVGQLDSILAKERRCIMLAVCRGKVSEGIDFKDSKARVVIITGIPFAPHMDPWVVLKKQYLDERKIQKQVIDSNVSNLSGQAWYMQSASRAVNQAVGRVIRHKNDWGAIFLMDDRFLSDHQSSQLSKWVKSDLRSYPKVQQGGHSNPFLTAMNHFHTFARQAMGNPNMNPIPSKIMTKRPNAPRFEEKNDSDGDEFDSYRKVVVLNANSIKDADNSSFVDPSLLLSQNVDKVNTRSINYVTNSTEDLLQKDTESDLLTTMNRIKRGNTKPANVSSVSKSLTTQLSQSVEQLSSKDKYTPLQKVMKSSTSSQNPFSNSYTSSSSSISSSRTNEAKRPSEKMGLSVDCLAEAFNIKREVAPWQVEEKVSTQPKTVKYHPFFEKHNTNKSNERNNLGSLNERDKNEKPSFSIDRYLQEEQELDDIATIKSYIEDLKSQLERSAYKNFRSVVKSASSSGLTEIRRIDEFVHNIIVALDTLDDSKVKSTLEVLAPLIPVKLRDAYRSSFRKALQSRKGKRKAIAMANTNDVPSKLATSNRESSLKMKKTDPMLATSSLDDSADESCEETVESVIQSQSENNTSSRRALALLGMSTQSSDKNKGNPGSRNNILSNARNNARNLSKAQSKQISRSNTQDNKSHKNVLSRIDSIGSMELSERSPSSTTNSIMKCLICTEYSNALHAASCGHVCCLKCWHRWFKEKKECPACRKSCSAESLVKISIKC